MSATNMIHKRIYSNTSQELKTRRTGNNNHQILRIDTLSIALKYLLAL